MSMREFMVARVTRFQGNMRVDEGKIIGVREVFSWISPWSWFNCVSIANDFNW